MRKAMFVGVLVVLLFCGVYGDLQADEIECASSLQALAPCIGYLEGMGKIPPSDCCTNVNEIRASNPRCLCLLIKDISDPSTGLTLNRTLIIQMPTQCQVSEQTLCCIDILNLVPSSPDAKIFEMGMTPSPSPSNGPKRTKLLAKYGSGFVAALLNVIPHLQGPQIFFVSTFNQCQERNFADPASVILVCVEVLSKFVLRHEVFALKASHVGQSLALPGLLFQHLCQFKSTECVSPRTMPLQNQARDFEKSTLLTGGAAAVRKVSVELCISCCRLLCALLTNYERESGHCISLLGDSLRIFLFCLEMVDLDTPGKLKAICWNMEEGIKCACWLRRVYEEMAHHKTLGRYHIHILSDYISIVSGCGPAKSGLKREIDEALRSGAYALVHVCSREDLQQLHAVFGEGPHRIALQTLINDCERYYNYKGKI